MSKGVSTWDHVSSELHADCKVYQVFKDRCRHPLSGKEGDFYLGKYSNWVQVIALTEDGQMVMVRQYRFGSKSITLELPAGCMNDGESPENAAIRELREETGYVGSRVNLIGSCEPNPALQDNLNYFVLIEDCKKIEDTDWDEHEELETCLYSKEEVLKKAKSGEITHALTLSALFRWSF